MYSDHLSTGMDGDVKPAGGAAGAAGLAGSCSRPFAAMSERVDVQLVRQRCRDAAAPRLQGQSARAPSNSWHHFIHECCYYGFNPCTLSGVSGGDGGSPGHAGLRQSVPTDLQYRGGSLEALRAQPVRGAAGNRDPRVAPFTGSPQLPGRTIDIL